MLKPFCPWCNDTTRRLRRFRVSSLVVIDLEAEELMYGFQCVFVGSRNAYSRFEAGGLVDV